MPNRKEQPNSEPAKYPIMSGSTLHRLLELIAQAVAVDLQKQTDATPGQSVTKSPPVKSLFVSGSDRPQHPDSRRDP